MTKTTKITKKTRRKSNETQDPNKQPMGVPNANAAFFDEPVCDRARRLAREKQEAEDKERSAKKQAFLDSMFKPGEYMVNQDGTYTICGWKWRVLVSEITNPARLVLNPHGPCGFRVSDNFYRGIFLRERTAYNLTQFGQALVEIDEEIAAIDKRYPNTFWGRIEHWIATH